MATQSNLETPLQLHANPIAQTPARLPRLWPPVLLLGAYWPIYLVWRYSDYGQEKGFFGFLIIAGVTLIVMLLFAAWWLFASRMRWSERLWIMGTALVSLAVAAVLSDKTLGPVLLLPGLPLVMTIASLAIFLTRRSPSPLRCRALMCVVCLSWLSFTLLRAQGMSGDGGMDLHWRWSLSPEQKYLAGLKPRSQDTLSVGGGPEITRYQRGDWYGFRGPNRDGMLKDERIATTWSASPPKLKWRRRIGPAWSSMAVVGERLYTQEQLGDQEAIVCLKLGHDGETGWSHEDRGRHDDVQGSAGPRATPTFANGRIFALGATGTLNCLNADNGDVHWTRNIATDAGAKKPMWGFSSSPLVVGDLAIVYAGETEKALLAYKVDSGEIAWTAPAGKISYSSPQLATIQGVRKF